MSNKGGLQAKWTILLSITTEELGLEMVRTLQHAFLGSLCSLVGTFESTHMAFYAKPLAFLCEVLRTLQHILGFMTS